MRDTLPGRYRSWRLRRPVLRLAAAVVEEGGRKPVSPGLRGCEATRALARGERSRAQSRPAPIVRCDTVPYSDAFRPRRRERSNSRRSCRHPTGGISAQVGTTLRGTVEEGASLL